MWRRPIETTNPKVKDLFRSAKKLYTIKYYFFLYIAPDLCYTKNWINMYSNNSLARKDIQLEVTVRKNDVAKAMRILKKKLEREGVLQELRQREYYEKPSAKKRREKKANINRTKKVAKERLREENSPST